MIKASYFSLAAVFGILSFPSFLHAAQEISLSQAKTKVEFLAVGSPGFLKIRGTLNEPEKNLKGKIIFHEKTLTVDGEALIDGFDTRNDLRNEHMKKKYLETEKHPSAKINIPNLKLPESFFQQGEAKEVPFEGNLALHGVERPISGKTEISRKGNAFHFNFAFQFKIQDFAVEIPSFMGVSVTKEVNVTVEVDSNVAAG